jgi:hypothetical protein
LGLCQQEPSFGQNEPRPSVLAIVAAVCLAKAFSCVNATVVAFGHRGNDDSESLPIPFSRSAARGLLLTSPPLPPPWSVEEQDACFVVRDHSGQALAYLYFEEEPGRPISSSTAHAKPPF